MPERIQLRRTKGWRLPPNTINVARPTTWGNPFVVGGINHKTGERIADRAHAVRLFEERWFSPTLLGTCMADLAAEQLRGFNLACWCPLDQPCHADVLLRVANVTPA
jgi:hypothetical protein